MASRDRALGLRQPPPADSFSNLTATLPSVCVTPSPDEVISALEYPASAASAASSIDISIADMATATDLLSVPGEPATPSQIKMRSRPRLSIPTLFTSSSWNGGGGTPRSILTSMPTIPSPSSSTTGGRRFSFSYIPMAIRRASWSVSYCTLNHPHGATPACVRRYRSNGRHLRYYQPNIEDLNT